MFWLLVGIAAAGSVASVALVFRDHYVAALGVFALTLAVGVRVTTTG